jgi:hypothetical protein
MLVRGRFARVAGLHAVANLESGDIEMASQIAHYPFALRLLLAGEHFADFERSDEREVWLYTMAGHVATKFPGDYRGPERVEREAAESMSGFEP